MTLRRFLRNALLVLGAVLLLLGCFVGGLYLYFHPTFTRLDKVVYGRRNGEDLTFDVVTPSKPKGLGVILMVSGGWKSGRDGFRPWMVASLLRRGYTVFAVSHVSQPKATVMEIYDDVSRAVRTIRHDAARYGVDPNRLGVTGGSAGGHLSLMVATRGGPGPAGGSDPVDGESSAVQAVAIFYPVTDLLNLGASTENTGDGGPPRSFVKAFGPDSTNMAVWKVIGREMSPIFHIHSNLPPTFILHGGADTLTPPDQSIRYQAAARAMGNTVELSIHPGGKHGWLTMVFDVHRFAKWFDRYLAAN